MGRFARLTIIGLLGGLTPALAGAQTPPHVPVAQLVPEMIASGAVLVPGSLAPGNDQSNHFVAAAAANPVLWISKLGGPIFADLRVLFPTGSSGLQPRPTGVFTVDYAF